MGGLKPDVLKEFVATLSKNTGEDLSLGEILDKFIEDSENRFKTVLADKKIDLPETGYWEVALIVQGDVPKHIANIDFLNLIDVSNPRYSGWPVWLDSRSFREKTSKPFVFNGV